MKNTYILPSLANNKFTEAEKIELNIEKKTTIVIDNLGFLTDNTVSAGILELISNPLCWCIYQSSRLFS